MKKLIFTLLLPLLLLSGCNKQDSVTYTGLEAGTMDSGVFTSDSETKMNVVGNEGNYDVRSARRVLIQFETRPATASDRIDIDLLGLMDAAIVLPDKVDTLPDDPDGSPIQVSDAWFSMQYLNILISFPGADASKHALTSSFTVSERGVFVRLHHDATTDTAAGDKVISAFLSVPLSDLQQAYEAFARSQGKKIGDYPMPVILQWTARTLEGGPLSVYERKGSYTPPVSNI